MLSNKVKPQVQIENCGNYWRKQTPLIFDLTEKLWFQHVVFKKNKMALWKCLGWTILIVKLNWTVLELVIFLFFDMENLVNLTISGSIATQF